jgi:DGQHR domain-containing protein
MDNKYVKFKCIEVTQPIGTFYIGSMDSKDLVYISYADIRRIEQRDIERIVGIQRPLSPSRVKELRQYVNIIDASFPTSVILAIGSEFAEYDEKSGTMKVLRNQGIAKIIDGQHRLAGLEAFERGLFEVNITIFIDMDIEDQALMFATINLKQTKVSKSLAYDLYEFASSRSPQKTCHDIVKLLNSKDGSPFKGRIKILGRATGKPYEFITQATFVERLMRYVSDNPMEDRNLIKKGKTPPRSTGIEESRLIFRNLFIDNKDAEIARILWNYFTAVSKRWPIAWASTEKGNILNRTQGFAGLMRFLGDLYNGFGGKGKIVQVSDFEVKLKKIKLEDKDFNTERYPPGTAGETKLYKELLEKSEIG